MAEFSCCLRLNLASCGHIIVGLPRVFVMAVAGLRGVECDTGDTDDSLTMELVRITRGRGCRVITTTGGLLMAHSQHTQTPDLWPGDAIRAIRGNQSDVKNVDPSSILTLSRLISEERAWRTRGRVSASVRLDLSHCGESGVWSVIRASSGTRR